MSIAPLTSPTPGKALAIPVIASPNTLSKAAPPPCNIASFIDILFPLSIEEANRPARPVAKFSYEAPYLNFTASAGVYKQILSVILVCV